MAVLRGMAPPAKDVAVRFRAPSGCANRLGHRSPRDLQALDRQHGVHAAAAKAFQIHRHELEAQRLELLDHLAAEARLEAAAARPRARPRSAPRRPCGSGPARAENRARGGTARRRRSSPAARASPFRHKQCGCSGRASPACPRWATPRPRPTGGSRPSSVRTRPSGLRTCRSRPACMPGRCSPRSSWFVPSHTTATPKRSASCLDLHEQFGLAEVAAIAAIGLIAGNRQLVGTDHFVANADLPGKRDALFQLAARQACAHARHGHCPIAQGQLGRLGHDRAVQSAGEGHGATAVALQQREQAVALGGKIGGGRHGSRDGIRAWV